LEAVETSRPTRPAAVAERSVDSVTAAT